MRHRDSDNSTEKKYANSSNFADLHTRAFSDTEKNNKYEIKDRDPCINFNLKQQNDRQV